MLVTGGSLAFPADVAQSTACPATPVASFIWPASPLRERSLCSRRGVGRKQFLYLPHHFRQVFSHFLARRHRGGWLLVFLVSVCFDRGNARLERGELCHHALFLGRKFDCLRDESCLKLLQQDFVGRSAHLGERLREEPAQVTSKHPHAFTLLLFPPEKLGGEPL
ncbi:hypothetical protein T11_4711 [Trichinella zimbabwensis]|uniref:Uncharacterized protein n=1 Tax=Trichinella zimbabwensis TaxID=268475 RepID=A0A0V1GQI1_9BILA|nr:hypothetical protein T11_17428 [Trichinella zimbabwensis]KRZ01578.1 hypothetical protein T11_16142 [Trichinella zimbabwensis]KRZ16566.1 hypothetical protein T11_4711 [Trichinella zimbabwensis]